MMAPIPDDNQEKPPSGDDELSTFSNGNVATITFSSDSSDENDENYHDSTGYTLLPQDPTGDDDDVDDYSENEINDSNVNNSLASSHVYGEDAHGQCADNLDGGSIADGSSINPDRLPDEVIQTEGVAVAPTVTASSASHHPEFLAKFPDGKIPSYMQVPNIAPNSSDMLWNKRRSDKGLSLDTEDNRIMRAMSGFSLPTENVPGWAKNLSEDQWNNVISQQIKPSQPTSDIACQPEQDPGSSLVCRGQKDENCDWVADFPDS